jgi:serine/threonine-protein kinase
MGDVWVARNLATSGLVAAKQCRADADGDATAERFRHEARVGSTLAHRGIVRVFDLLEQPGGRPWLVMELLRGQPLERHLARAGPLPAREAIAIATAVLAALSHAHDHGILHRDVTPANVFLAVDPDGQVTPKLVDFGLAKAPDTTVKTTDGRVLGTPRYMAPERIRAAADVDGRSDLFSVAVVLYEMLTGTCPFAAATPAASLAAVLEAVVDPEPRIPPRVWLEVQRALAKRPYERHASARELSAALLAASGETEASLAGCLSGLVVAEDEALEPLGAQPAERATAGGRLRAPRMPALLAVAAAVLLVGGMAAAVRGRAAPAAALPTSIDARPPARPLPSPEPPSPIPASALEPPPSSTVPVASSGPPIAPRPSGHPRPRPIATSPGF